MSSRTIALPGRETKADAVILADGEYPESGIAAEILNTSGNIVCCDGAADNFIARGGRPAAIVGDCDSLSDAVKECYGDIVHCSPDQETNDLTKAFEYCVGHGARSIVILGATGKREDHTIANISLLADYALRADVCMVTASGVFNAIHETAGFESFKGQAVSIFTIATTTGIKVDGLLYTPPADGLCGWWRGSLNEAAGDSFTIFTDGPTIVFRAFGR